MEKEKINVFKISCYMSILTMIALILVSATYAKYTSYSSGTSLALVAKWSIKVNGDEIGFAEEETEIEFDLFGTVQDEDGEIEEDVAEGFIAPGTQGSFEFAVENASEVAAEYKINFEVENENNIPLLFSIDGGENWTQELEETYPYTIDVGGPIDYVTVQWKWPFETDNTETDDVEDTTLGDMAIDPDTAPVIKVTAIIEAVQAGIERTGKDGQFRYVKLNKDEIQISRYLGTSTDLVIPAEYDGYKVVAIENYDARPSSGKRYNIIGANNATSNATIKSLTISEGIEKIGVGAFHQFTALQGNLILPNSLKEIGEFAFNGCKKLTGDLNIPNNVVKIGDAAFQSCSGFNGYLTLSNSLEEIGSSVFNHLSNLKNTTIDIPKTLKIIGRASGDGTHTFYNSATKYIAAFTIDGSTNASSDYYKVVDGVLLSADGTRLVSYPTNKIERDTNGNITNTYIMPEGITKLDEMAFGRSGSKYSANAAESLKKLVLPNSYKIRSITPNVFLNKDYNDLAVACYIYTGINEIIVKEDNPYYKTIDGILYSKDGKELWYVPTAYEGVAKIADTVTTIKAGAFYTTNSSLTGVEIPASVTLIEPGALEVLDTLTKKTTIDENNPVYTIENGKIVTK